MTESIPTRDGSHDFDFFMGSWKVHHRRLRERLANCNDWEEFEGTCEAGKVLDGRANFDESTMHRTTGAGNGMTLRLYDSKTGEWSLYWAATGSGSLDIPMIGSFESQNGIGKFYAHETYNGKHVYSRFIWSKISPTFCQWEQAYSTDGGATWETNWVMEHTRVEK